MKYLRPPSALFAALALVCGCASDDSGPVEPGYDPAPGCNPIAAEWDCIAPYPSDFFLVDGRVGLDGASGLVDEISDAPLDPFRVHHPDGFPKLPQIVAYVPGELDDGVLAFHDDPAPTLDPATSRTVLLHAATGAPVLHFAELDPGALPDERKALLIRPMTRLVDGERYVVALRDLSRPDGSKVEPPEGFRRLRDDEAPGHPALEPLAERYEADVFDILAGAGVSRDELVLAWDFTVSTEEDSTGDMLAMRDALMASLEAEPPVVTIAERTEAPDDPHVAYVVRGTVEIPLFVDADGPGARLFRDSSGAVVESGETTLMPFSLVVPPSVADGTLGSPARLIQYGHGFFGERDEAESEWLGVTLDELGAVAVATDYVGMSREDFGAILEDIGESPAQAFFFTDRLHQGMANQIALAYAATGPLLEALAADPETADLYDPSTIQYYGNSNGHILGSTYVVLSPQIDRAVLGVGGIGYSFMMFRAQPFASFVGFFELFLPDRLQVQLFTSMSQSILDRIDPVAYAPHMLEDTYPGSPASRRVLLQYGPGDHAVPYLATELQARTLGIPVLGPVSHPIAALDVVDGPVDGSALSQFDFGVPEPLPGTVAIPPTEETAPHEGVRRLPEAIEQLDVFLATGTSVPRD
jgi:hypothetical protein